MAVEIAIINPNHFGSSDHGGSCNTMKSVIKCNCGHRVLAKDVMQTGYYLRLVGPSFVYVKFRCSHCKKLGEQFAVLVI